MNATTDTLAFFGNYGLTNRWDVGFVVPLVRIDLEASVLATIQRLATQSSPLTHTFEAGNPQATQKTFESAGSATGLGDIVVRNKYRFLDFAGGGLAAGLDVRLPTGDQEELLGAGTQVKMFFIASGGTDRLVEHVNIGYTAVTSDVSPITGLPVTSTGGSLPDELNYAAGVEFVAHPRLTIIADVVGRNLRGSGRLELSSKSFEYQGATSVQTAQFEEFESRSGNLNLVLGTAGFKFNPTGDLLVSASVLFPLSDTGLRSKLTTVIGLDYAF